MCWSNEQPFPYVVGKEGMNLSTPVDDTREVTIYQDNNSIPMARLFDPGKGLTHIYVI